MSYEKPFNSLNFDETESFSITTPERKILSLLIAKEGEICSREELVKEAWENMDYIGSNSLNVAVSNLRKILKPKGIMIKTVPRQGYLLVIDGFEAEINNTIGSSNKSINFSTKLSTPYFTTIVENKKNEIKGVTLLYIILIIFSCSIIVFVANNLVYNDNYIIM